MLVEDCLQLLFLPEWPSSELLISILVTYLMQIVREDKISVNAFVLSLELLGKIGMSFLVFKKKEIEFIDVNQNITLQSLEKLIKSINPVMEKIDGQKAEYDSFAHYAYAYLFTLYGSIIFNLPTNDAIKLATLAEEKRLLRIGFENRWPRNGSDDNVGVGQMYFNFLLSRPCSHYYDSILSSVLLILDHPKIQIRTRALKVVSQFLDQNSAIFSFKKVQASLSERIVDPAISVREVAVDIV
jgi:cohesin loading factor subunit SCC2